MMRKKRTTPEGEKCPDGQEYSDQFRSCIARKTMMQGDIDVTVADDIMWVKNKGEKSGIFGIFKVHASEGPLGTELDVRSGRTNALVFVNGELIETSHLEILIPNEEGRKKHISRYRTLKRRLVLKGET